jgi:hypothetical protein
MISLLNDLFGILAPVVSAIAFIPYVISIFKGETKPSAASWWTWSILALVATLSAFAAHAALSVLLLPAWLFVSQLFVAILCIKFGDNHWDLRNKLCAASALISVAVWIFTGNPLLALGLTILADLFASIPNFRHVAKNPEQEDRFAWSLGWLSALFEIFAIKNWNFASYGWAIYFFLNMSVILFFLYRGKKKVTAK